VPLAEQAVVLRWSGHVAPRSLAPVVTIEVPSTQVGVLSRATWLHRTLPRWKTTVEPVAKYMAGAIGEAISSQVEQMPMEMPGGDPGAMMERIGGTLFVRQFRQAGGSLARA